MLGGDSNRFLFHPTLALTAVPPPQGCSGSICQKHHLEVCTCASEEGKDEAVEMCHVCCMEKGERPSGASAASEQLCPAQGRQRI